MIYFYILAKFYFKTTIVIHLMKRGITFLLTYPVLAQKDLTYHQPTRKAYSIFIKCIFNSDLSP